jgi:hypothetical protein
MHRLLKKLANDLFKFQDFFQFFWSKELAGRHLKRYENG